MSTATTTVQPDAGPIVLERTQIKSWKAPIALGVFAIIGLILFFGLSPRAKAASASPNRVT